jgi:predicted phage terminase large subunit-like protein
VDPEIYRQVIHNPSSPTPLSSRPSNEIRPYTEWLKAVTPNYNWDWPHLDHIRDHLALVTAGYIRKLAISLGPQHGKTEGLTVRYPLWRMLRTPGLRVGVCCYNQRFTNKQSRKTRRIVRSLNLQFGDVNTVDEWILSNGSTYIARGAGAGISGEPLDCVLLDDPFKNRAEADSPTVQERVYEWYMDDVTPRVQRAGSMIVIHTRFGPGDLIGRIQDSAEAKDWTFLRLPAIAETQEERDTINARQGLPTGVKDPINREPGMPLCEDRYPLSELQSKRLTMGVGFEAEYQQNPIPRGGTFFERSWFLSPDGKPVLSSIDDVLKLSHVDGKPTARFMRYYDLASSRNDAACFTAGVLLAKIGDAETARFYVCDVIRGRWMPAERNDKMLEVAQLDAQIPGFEKTWFESPVFDKNKAAARAIIAKLAGHPVSGDNVSTQGSKELRAEPVAGAAKAGIIKCIGFSTLHTFLGEVEAFPRGTYRDQVDSLSGCYNRLSRGGFAFAVG